MTKKIGKVIFAKCAPSRILKLQVTVNSRHPAAFELFLNYMYSGTVVIDRSSVVELLRFANNFLVFRLGRKPKRTRDFSDNETQKLLYRVFGSISGRGELLINTKFSAEIQLAIVSEGKKFVDNLFPDFSLFQSSTDYFDSNLNRCLLESSDIIDYSFTQLTRLVRDHKYADVITSDTYLK